MSQKKPDVLNEEYKYGFRDEDVSIFSTGKGLSEEVVREISKAKGEPEWMLERRLKAFRHWQTMKLPTWVHP